MFFKNLFTNFFWVCRTLKRVTNPNIVSEYHNWTILFFLWFTCIFQSWTFVTCWHPCVLCRICESCLTQYFISSRILQYVYYRKYGDCKKINFWHFHSFWGPLSSKKFFLKWSLTDCMQFWRENHLVDFHQMRKLVCASLWNRLFVLLSRVSRVYYLA